MKITRIGNPEIIMQNPDSIHNYFAWPTAVRLQNGKIAVAASGFRKEHICPFGKTVISYSEDEGKTYTAPAPIFDTPLDDRDGGIMTFGKTGVIVTSFNNTVNEQRSWAKQRIKDEGIRAYFNSYLDTITPENEDKYHGSLFRISNDCGVTFGPIYKCPVSSPHGPCELPDGTILYVGWEYGKSNSNKGTHEFIQAYKISPDGTSEYLGEIPPIELDGEQLYSEEPHAFALDDGTVICHIRTQDEAGWPYRIFTVCQSVSKDGGRTWTKPEPIVDDRRYGAPPHIMKHSSGVLISAVSCRLDPTGIKAIFSEDNGETWKEGGDVCVLDRGWDIGYPSTVELNDGSLLTVFYAHAEKDGPAVIMQQRWRLEA